jgi:hypothetical protein
VWSGGVTRDLERLQRSFAIDLQSLQLTLEYLESATRGVGDLAALNGALGEALIEARRAAHGRPPDPVDYAGSMMIETPADFR